MVTCRWYHPYRRDHQASLDDDPPPHSTGARGDDDDNRLWWREEEARDARWLPDPWAPVKALVGLFILSPYDVPWLNARGQQRTRRAGDMSTRLSDKVFRTCPLPLDMLL